MSTFVKILKSNDVEARERHVNRIKKEITHLNEELQINLEALEKLRNKQQDSE